MLLKPTKTNLKKLETLFQEIGYKLIYEKGHFHSGYCIVNDQKTIVINKFFKTEARINCLFSVLNEIEVDEESLEEDVLDFYKQCVVLLEENN